jgi:hypothetical protein
MPAANWLTRPQVEPGMPELVGQYELEMRRMIQNLYNSPSVVSWVLFNEGLGIKSALPMKEVNKQVVRRMVAVAQSEDPTRLINHESGAEGYAFQGKNPWDIGIGQIIDYHCYFTLNVPKPTADRAAVVGEYGYERYSKAAPKYAPTVAAGISGLVYTQLTDVESERNGLLNYRREFKVPGEKKTQKSWNQIDASDAVDEIAKLNEELFGRWTSSGAAAVAP